VINDPNLTATISSTNFYHNTAKNIGGAIKASISAGGTALRMDRIRMVDNQAIPPRATRLRHSCMQKLIMTP
jgi:predicted outer membrane repeat protein